jgi:hypothetical protein
MRGVRARNRRFLNLTRSVFDVALISAVVLMAMAGCASAQAGQTGAGTASATSTAAPTDAPAPTATPQPTPTATLVPFSGKIIRVKNSAAWINGTVSATCPTGTVLIGGGVDNGYGTSGIDTVEASYPISSHTWKVIGPASTVPYKLSAIADCLQATRSVTTTIVKLTSPTSSYKLGGGLPGVAFIYDVRCSHGIVTGGGYDVAGGSIVDSHPDGANGWITTVAGGTLTAYAICSSAPIKVSVVRQTASYPKYSGNGPVPVVQTTLSCPSGSAALSGGFGEPQSSNVQVGWGPNELAFSGQQWIVTGANKSGVAVQTGYAYILCARLS